MWNHLFSSKTDIHLTAFSYSDWVVDFNTRRSVIGYVVCLSNNPILRQPKKQTSVSRNSTKVQYKALAHIAADVACIRLLFKDLRVVLSNPLIIYCDNMLAVALSANLVYHSRIKHLDTNYHFVGERVHKGDLLVQHLPTNEETIDVITKGLRTPTFNRHCFNLKLGYISQWGLREMN